MKKSTKINDIKDFESLVHTRSCEMHAVITRIDRDNGAQMRSKMFDKVDAGARFFPKLDMTINGCCNEEICSSSVNIKSYGVTDTKLTMSRCINERS